MVERYRANSNPSGPGNPFLDRKEIKFLTTGCTLLNCVIGGRRGGWPFGRMVNIIGDKSTGKTLLAEEAFANLFMKKNGVALYPGAKGYYRETESAFDVSYARALGVDVSRIDFGPNGPDTHWQMMEDVMEDLERILGDYEAKALEKARVLKKLKGNRSKSLDQLVIAAAKTLPPTLYVIDSLDALTTRAEIKRDLDEGSYNLEKQKIFGKLFRTMVGRIKRANMCLMIISQTRDRIGPMIRGRKYRRHCDKVLDFYASVVIYLADLGKVYETKKNIKRPVAIRVRARADKNKIYVPFKECVFELRFGYGIDDEFACLDYLKEVKRLEDFGLSKVPESLSADIDVERLRQTTIDVFADVEGMFLPAKGKYAA
jgi:recombination protein RecA